VVIFTKKHIKLTLHMEADMVGKATNSIISFYN
jgi:hypothetical protein